MNRTIERTTHFEEKLSILEKQGVPRLEEWINGMEFIASKNPASGELISALNNEMTMVI